MGTAVAMLGRWVRVVYIGRDTCGTWRILGGVVEDVVENCWGHRHRNRQMGGACFFFFGEW